MTFGHWLRSNRTEKRLSQEALAARIGVDRTYISKVENGGIGTPEVETRKKLHREFGTSDDELVRLGILERVDVTGSTPFYVPASTRSATIRAIHETEERYDEIDARLRLRNRAEHLTEAQAAAILSLLDTFTPES